MTNQPEESHPLRDRVDDAISWFTATNEPPEPTAAAAAGERTPVADERTPVADEGTPVAHEGTPVAEERTPVADEGTPVAHEGTPVAEERTPVADEGTPVAHEGTPVAEEGTPAAQPAAPLVEETQATKPVAPDAAVHDVTADTPVAAHLPGNEAAPVEIPSEPVADETKVAPERVYEADEFSAHPVSESSEPLVSEPKDVAPERVSEADDFVPARAGEVPVPVDATPVATEPVADQADSSDVEEPTRVHPIEPPSSWAEVHPQARALPADELPSEAGSSAGQRSLFRDEAPTVALPAAAAATAAAVPLMERTAVLDAQEAARVRREERAARDRQLGKVIAAPDDADAPLVTPFKPPTTYKGLPSLGFLLFRLIVAAVVGIRAYQHIAHLSATRDMWAATVVPSPGIVAWTQIGLEIAIVVMLVLGLGTRIAGLLLLILAIAQLAFIQWGVVSPFQAGAADFIGVVDVLLAGAGLVFATVGGGRLAFDGAIHTGHIRRKNDKLFA